MTVQSTLEQKLTQAFTPEHLQVINESHQHAVPRDSETHFKVVVVSDRFEGLRKIARHQQVYGLVDEELKGGVHALTLHLYTPQEWQQRAAPAPDSPNCMGGSKAEQP